MIQQNITEKSRAVAAVKAHCMCFNYSPGFVTFPEGYGYEGVHFLDTTDGHEQVLAIMERLWKAFELLKKASPEDKPHAV